MNLKQQQTRAQPVEMPDEEDLELGAEWTEPDPFIVENGSEEFHYYLAATNAPPTDVQSVAACKARGYEVCKEEKSLSVDLTLMRIPKKIFDARRNAKRKARMKAREQIATPKGVPEDAIHRLKG
jgi:hypothetical protein